MPRTAPSPVRLNTQPATPSASTAVCGTTSSWARNATRMASESVVHMLRIDPCTSAE